MEDGSSVRRLVTGSCDNSVRVWAYNVQLNKWQEESKQASPHKGLNLIRPFAIIRHIICYLCMHVTS